MAPEKVQDKTLHLLLNDFNPATPAPSRIAMEISTDIIPPEAYTDTWYVFTSLIPAMRERIIQHFGVSLPFIQFRPNTYIGTQRYVIMLDDIPQERGNAKTDEYDAIIGHLENVIINHLELFMDIQYTVYWGDEFKPHAAVEAENAEDTFANRIKKNPDQLVTFNLVLKNLLHERVPITQKDTIIRIFFDTYNEGDEVSELTQLIRAHLKQQLPVNQPGVIMKQLPPETEKLLLDALRTDEGKVFLSISPEDCQEAMAEIRNLLQENTGSTPVALITQHDRLRPHLQKIAEYEFPKVIVSSKSEVLERKTTEV